MIVTGLPFGGGHGDTSRLPKITDDFDLDAFWADATEDMVDVEEDEAGWFTVARTRYPQGTRLDIVVSDMCDREEQAYLISDAVPAGAFFLGVQESGTFGSVVEYEYTYSWLILEDYPVG